jgi:hypothetical protein
MSLRSVGLGALVLLVAAACSDPATKPGPAVVTGTPPVTGGGGGGGSDGGTDGGDAGDDAGVCTDLANTGTLVDRTGVQGDPPTSTGGTVVDGTYDLSAYTVYVGTSGVAGPTGITAKASIRIGAGKIDEVLELGGTGKTTTTTATRSGYAASGATFAETQLCPATGAGAQLQFTASDTLLVLTDLSTKEAFTFTKR